MMLAEKLLYSVCVHICSVSCQRAEIDIRTEATWGGKER